MASVTRAIAEVAFGRLVSEFVAHGCGKASKVTNKSQIEGKWATKCDGREQTLMSAFVVDPMDAQKPWQVSLGLLLCLWALGQRIRASDAAKLAKSLTKAKSKEMGGTPNAMVGNKH